MRASMENYKNLIWVSLLGTLIAISLAQAAYSAEIFKCTSWTKASLSHRGPVTIAIDAEVLTWRTDTASSTAKSIRQGGTFAAYVGDAHVYFVFGSLFFDIDMVGPKLTVRRIPFVRKNPRIGEIECN